MYGTSYGPNMNALPKYGCLQVLQIYSVKKSSTNNYEPCEICLCGNELVENMLHKLVCRTSRNRWATNSGIYALFFSYFRRQYLNNRVFLSRNYRLIVAPRKLDVLKTNICPRSEASRANMLVLRTSNFQGATIGSIVPRHKHSIVFIVHH